MSLVFELFLRLGRAERLPLQPPLPLPEALPAPVVSAQEMWKKAISLGGPKDAVAQVSYDAKGYGFWITGTKILLRWRVDGSLDELRSTPRE